MLRQQRVDACDVVVFFVVVVAAGVEIVVDVDA